MFYLLCSLVVRSADSLASYKQPPPPIVACKSTAQVNDAISFYIRPTDTVLELGAQLSDTSTHLCRTIASSGKAVLVDVERKEATSGRSKYRDVMPFLGSSCMQSNPRNDTETFVERVQYQELQSFDQWRELCKGEHHYDVLILDVGSMIGNDLHLSALSLAAEFIANQEEDPRAVIIKSKALFGLARRILHSQRLLDGTIPLPQNLQRTPDPIIVPCVGVHDYRKTIPLFVRRGDDVIEVGCHFGTTTSLLYDAVAQNCDSPRDNHMRQGFCAGVDIGEKIIAKARTKHSGPVFEVANAWNTLDLLKVKTKRDGSPIAPSASWGYDIVYADIGGLSGAHGLLESLALLDSLSKALEPRCIVIKSSCMKKLASQLAPFPVERRKIEAANKENVR